MSPWGRQATVFSSDSSPESGQSNSGMRKTVDLLKPEAADVFAAIQQSEALLNEFA